ncbi:hypothetical protein WMF18_10595 [Sorangium sp. So ce315]|uniref:hypothetical protein n=1 Tax=Sorangium sp. So ce315 TaxID=3133299 RepID=UPI003F6162E8
MSGSTPPGPPPAPAVVPPPEPLVELLLVELLLVELLLVAPTAGVDAPPPVPVTAEVVSPELPPSPSGVGPRSAPPEHAASRAANDGKPSQRIRIVFERIPILFCRREW